MYFTNFFTSLTKKSNIPTLIYLVLNVLMITAIFQVILNQGNPDRANFFICLASAIALYAVSIMIALSPVGEWILRLQNGCKRIKDAGQLARIEPIFNEVYSKAKEMHPELPDGIKIYIEEKKGKKKDGEEGPNAFAAGRKTICVTEALLKQPDEQIKAVLAHEFGHLAHHDTEIILVITVGNMIVTVLLSCILAVCTILKTFFSSLSDSEAGIGGAAGLVMTAIFIAAINLFNRFWSQIGVWMCMKSSRDNEYLADEFSFNLGYGVPLCQFLDKWAQGSCPEGLFAALASTHPATGDRIARLKSLGCEYTN